MTSIAPHGAAQCPTHEISAYIDGELDLVREIELDAHFAECKSCLSELNQQKEFLCGLNASLKEEENLELPPDFAKHIVANAESTVSGLRRPAERYNAVFICIGLVLFVLFAMGAEAGKMITSMYGFFEQTAVVAGVLSHLIYSLFLGVVIVMRSFASQLQLDVVAGVGMAGFVGIVLALISRRVLRMLRV